MPENRKRYLRGPGSLFPVLLFAGWTLVLFPVPVLAEGEPVEKPADSGEREESLPAEILCTDPDGDNDWFREVPEVAIRCFEGDTVVRYRIELPSGKQAVGEGRPEYQEQEYTVKIPDNVWEDGENLLTVWVVRQTDGKARFHEKRSIFLDKTAPSEVCFSHPASSEEEILYSCGSTEVSVTCSDDASGIEKIVYALENGEESVIEGDSGQIRIKPGYRGRIRAFAVNGAGAAGDVAVSGMIVCEENGPEILLETDGGFDIWHHGEAEVRVSVRDNEKRDGFASGVRSLTCYVGNELAGRKTWDDSGKCVLSDSLTFRTDRSSYAGEPVILTVHASDRAGNTTVKTQRLYIDRAAPVLEISGIHEQMISAGPVDVLFEAEEENVLEICELSVSHTGTDGAVTVSAEAGNAVWKQTERGKQAELIFQEDGIYDCVFTAQDAAGHRSEQKLIFTIDSHSPVIRYVGQLDGTDIPYFHWNYSSEEMVSDFTEYTYRMLLDGRIYLPGTRITEEGSHLLEVQAEDAAGNMSAATAVFSIDSTPPRIQWGNTEEGGCYEEKNELCVWVDGGEERLTYLSIDGIEQKLSPDSIIFQTEITEYGVHRVKVRAEDRAGNISEDQICFEVRAGENLFSRVIRRAGEGMSYTDRTTMDGKEGGDGGNVMLLTAGCTAAVAGTAGLVFCVRKVRKKRKTP